MEYTLVFLLGWSVGCFGIASKVPNDSDCEAWTNSIFFTKLSMIVGTLSVVGLIYINW